MACLGIRASSIDTERTSKASANSVRANSVQTSLRTQHVITRDQVKHKRSAFLFPYPLTSRSPSFGVHVLTCPSLWFPDREFPSCVWLTTGWPPHNCLTTVTSAFLNEFGGAGQTGYPTVPFTCGRGCDRLLPYRQGTCRLVRSAASRGETTCRL